MDPHDALEYIDENTIGVMVILGSTYTGHFEDVHLMSHLCKVLSNWEKYDADIASLIVDGLQKRTGLDIPIHVDAASGGFITPFVYPHLKWSFEVPRVVSINTSGHKFGLVYAGLGWILWRDESFLHKDLIFELRKLPIETDLSLTFLTHDYPMKTIWAAPNTRSPCIVYLFVSHLIRSLTTCSNFSKPAAPVIAQMYNFLNLGFEGYKRIATKDLRNARMLSKALENTYFKVILPTPHDYDLI
jgi:glutamate decarboxylase